MDQIENNHPLPKSNVYYFEDEQFVCEGYKGPGWYFWDETDTNLIGPFSSQYRALTALKVFSTSL